MKSRIDQMKETFASIQFRHIPVSYLETQKIKT
jgi:hypothetical protein